MVFLGNREFYKAVDYFDKVLDIDPKYARAYWGSLLASYQCATDHELVNCASDDWTEDAKLKNALQFASTEEKQLYDDVLTKRVENFKKLCYTSLENKDFEKSVAWCDKYIYRDREDGSIWWVKLLAMNQSCNSNELYERCLDNAVSIMETDEYLNAVKYSIEEESQMYEKTARKIEEAVSEKKRSQAYDEGKSYMKSAVDALHRKLKQSLATQWRDSQRENDVLRAYKNHKGKLFRNNLFSFLLQALFYAVVMYALVALLAINNGETDDFFVYFLVFWGILMGFVLLIHVCVALAWQKKVSRLSKDCREASEKLDEDKEIIRVTEKKTKMAEQLLAQYMERQDLSLEQIKAQRRRFDQICENPDNRPA